MNAFLEELDSMTNCRFWQQLLERQLSRPATTQTTERTTKTMQMSSLLSPNKPTFSSSAFFDPKSHPTLTDQVFLCREIAKQLVSDETNAKSKGRQMFDKRVQKSHKWITADEDDTDDHTWRPHISSGPPNLRLVVDPRHVQDLSSLSFESNETEIMKQETRTRHLSEAIVWDLTSPDMLPNKGNVLFAKRQQKSDEWVVDDAIEAMPTTEETTPTTTPETTAETTLLSMARKYRDFNAKAKPFSRSQ